MLCSHKRSPGLHCLSLSWGRQPKQIWHVLVHIGAYTCHATTPIPENQRLTSGVSLWWSAEGAEGSVSITSYSDVSARLHPTSSRLPVTPVCKAALRW